MKIVSIDVIAKEWFDKINGNSYHSAQITLNFGMEDEKRLYVPFQYGYGDVYLDNAARRILDLEPVIGYGLPRYCRENNKILRHSIETGCKKKDVEYWGNSANFEPSNTLKDN